MLLCWHISHEDNHNFSTNDWVFVWSIPVLLDLIKNSGINIVSYSVADGKWWKLLPATLKLIVIALLSKTKINDFLLSMNFKWKDSNCINRFYKCVFNLLYFLEDVILQALKETAAQFKRQSQSLRQVRNYYSYRDYYSGMKSLSLHYSL